MRFGLAMMVMVNFPLIGLGDYIMHLSVKSLTLYLASS